MTAVRGEGARCDGEPIATATTQRLADVRDRASTASPTATGDGASSARSDRRPWRSATSAPGGWTAWIEAHDVVAPWDYLGGMLVAREAGALVIDANGRELVVTDHDARRQVVGRRDARAPR